MSKQTERNIEAVKKGLEAFSAGDMETMMSLLDDKIEWVQPGDSAISGTYHGKRELGDWFRRVGEKSATIKPLQFLADGDTVVVLSEVTVGKEKAPTANVYTLRDGKVTRADNYTDTAMTERIWGRKKAAAR
jgi:uncharacterized protein